MNAFLNGELCEEVYIHPRPGYSAPGDLLCSLHRSLYGFKQAPHARFECSASVVAAAMSMT